MNKIFQKYSAWYSAMAVIIAVFTQIFLQPLLSYAEGWHTFYYDKSYVSLLMDNGGVGEVIRCFLLQFFHHPWHGVAIVTVLMLCLMILVHLIVRPLVRKVKKEYVRIIIIMAVQAVVLVASAIIAMNQIGHNMTYARLSNMARNEQWDDIITTCKKQSPVNNLLYQNLLNMALAEKCELGDRLLEEPVVDIRSIYVNEIQSYEVAGLLSDVYYSMGHIAQSQMYAFEANEKVGNFSPRMLQRLVMTNLLYGNNKVARKYMYWLSKTIYYKDWVKSYLWCTPYSDNGFAEEESAWHTIDNPTEEYHNPLAEKRRCIFPDNRFSGIKGIDDDLLNVARNTRGSHQCKVTLQYLGSLYILAGYTDQFVSMVKEFGGSKDLPKPLPKCFDDYYKHLTQR